MSSCPCHISPLCTKERESPRRRLASLSELIPTDRGMITLITTRMGMSTTPASVDIQMSREALKSVISRSRGGRADVRLSANIFFLATL